MLSPATRGRLVTLKQIQRLRCGRYARNALLWEDQKSKIPNIAGAARRRSRPKAAKASEASNGICSLVRNILCLL